MNAICGINNLGLRPVGASLSPIAMPGALHPGLMITSLWDFFSRI